MVGYILFVQHMQMNIQMCCKMFKYLYFYIFTTVIKGDVKTSPF